MDKTEHSYTLIKGQFDPESAWSILFALVNSKINFHGMESFGITIRSNGDTSFHEKRIRELSQTNQDIKKLIDKAADSKKHLNIEGNIKITLVDA